MPTLSADVLSTSRSYWTSSNKFRYPDDITRCPPDDHCLSPHTPEPPLPSSTVLTPAATASALHTTAHSPDALSNINLTTVNTSDYALGDKSHLQPFEPEVTALEPYPITEYQSVYFVAESFEKARKQFREYALKLRKPFQVEYDTATESVKIIDPVNHVSGLLEQLRGNIQKVQDYVRHHMVKS
nr:unnamed protein product [Spirometra erinaceieuropaei]